MLRFDSSMWPPLAASADLLKPPLILVPLAIKMAPFSDLRPILWSPPPPGVVSLMLPLFRVRVLPALRICAPMWGPFWVGPFRTISELVTYDMAHGSLSADAKPELRYVEF